MQRIVTASRLSSTGSHLFKESRNARGINADWL